jgi:hypothetical protein
MWVCFCGENRKLIFYASVTDIVLQHFLIKQDVLYANFPWIFQYHLAKGAEIWPMSKNSSTLGLPHSPVVSLITDLWSETIPSRTEIEYTHQEGDAHSNHGTLIINKYIQSYQLRRVSWFCCMEQWQAGILFAKVVETWTSKSELAIKHHWKFINRCYWDTLRKRMEMHQSPTPGIFPDLCHLGIAQPML